MPGPSPIHRAAWNGDVEKLRRLLMPAGPEEALLNDYDHKGRTPLMYAVSSLKSNGEVVRLLLESGADLHQRSRGQIEQGQSILEIAIRSGDPEIVALLLQHGADLHYTRTHGYDALTDAALGRNAQRDSRLPVLLKLLLDNGAASKSVTSDRESALRALSYLGRFDALQILLDAGADEAQLKWTPLIRAVALGSISDVQEALRGGVYLEETDWCGRTAWLVAIHRGDIEKARLLLDSGADRAARGRCGKPSLFYAIESHHTPMLRWLLDIGTSIDQADDFGSTPLMEAVEAGNVEAVKVLLEAGVEVDSENNGQTALSVVQSRELAAMLLDAGADPRHLSFEGRRALVGLEPDPDDLLLDVSRDEFERGRSRRFGASNPERIHDPFREGMIRSGVPAAGARYLYTGGFSEGGSPVWCAQRFGQSITRLPDGRIVQVGGEHEDHYDEDFCIYNDVFVHAADGTISVFDYPEAVFPPTDFHTATLIGEYIYVIGSLGYHGARHYGTTPVYRLDTNTFRMEKVEVEGVAPGWIYGHRAVLENARQVRISGGKIVTSEGREEIHAENHSVYTLDTARMAWSAEAK